MSAREASSQLHWWFFLNKITRFSLCMFSPPRFYASPVSRLQLLFNGEEPVDGTTLGDLWQE